MTVLQRRLDSVFLDDLPLTGAVLHDGGGAQDCLHGLGLTGTCTAATDANAAPLTLHFEGLRAEIWPHLHPSADGQIPASLRDHIWPDPVARVLYLCDAARLTGGNGGIDWADLQAQCLFTGAAAERLTNVAPYLIPLEPDQPLARRLFRDDGRHWSFWPLGAGIFLHPTAPMADIHKGLRHFTKLSDGRSWKFLRLAEPRTLLPMLMGLSPGLRGRLFQGIKQMIAIDPDEGLLIKIHSTDVPEQIPARIEPRLQAMLDAAVRARFGREALRFCRETIIDRAAPDNLDSTYFGGLALRAAQSAGIYDRQAVLLAAAAAWCANSADGGWLVKQTDLTQRRDLSQIERARALLRRAYAGGS